MDIKTKTFKWLISISGFLILFTAIPLTASAELNDPLIFKPQVGLPGFDTTTALTKNDTSYISIMVKSFYDYGLGIGGILAAIMLMAGGVLWLTSAGSSDQVGRAKKIMIGSITGLLLLFAAWLILKTINPALVELRANALPKIKKITFGCCQYADKAAMETSSECERGGGNFLIKSNNPMNPGYYNVDGNRKNCTLPGCCVTKSTSGTVLSCADTMSHNCNSGTFINALCTYASSQVGGCPTKDICAEPDTDRGDHCFKESGYGQCWCYDTIAWYNKGNLGEPCGNEIGAACTDKYYNNLTGIHCEGDTMYHDQGGRDCTSGLACCYDDREQ